MENKKCEFHEKGDCEGEIELRGSMTAFHYDEEDRKAGKPDPNAKFMACQAHYEEYREFWQSQWDEYWSSVL